MQIDWLAWYYMIYWLPLSFGILALLSAGMGGHRARAGQGAAAHGRAGTPHRGAGPGRSHARGARHGPRANHTQGQDVHGAFHAVLDFLGFDRAPALIVLSCLLLGWGLAGLLSTQFLQPAVPSGFQGLAALIGGTTAIAFTRVMSRLVMYLIPADESYATGTDDFVGLSGRVVREVTETTGRVHVYDRVRTLHDRFARCRVGHVPIPANSTVTVLGVDADTGNLLVDPLD
jgi:hypothetical protein